MKLTEDEKDRLVEAAQAILRDERHWSAVDVADRAEAGHDLAGLLLDILQTDVDGCPDPCDECKTHRENCAEEESK
jgi:hypothetical protein